MSTFGSPWEALKGGFRKACVKRLVGDEDGAIDVLKNEIPLLVVSWAKSSSLEPSEKKAKLKEVFDDDLIALVGEDHGDNQSYKLGLTSLHVVCGTQGPQKAALELKIDDEIHSVTATGDGPVDATFNAVKELFPHTAKLQLYQVHAVTEGTDAQATVTVRMEEDGKIATGQSADTDTVVASAKAYINALNKLVIKREKSLPGEDTKSVSYKDAG